MNDFGGEPSEGAASSLLAQKSLLERVSLCFDLGRESRRDDEDF